MGQGLLNQGAWSQLSQGAWQVQSQAFSDTLTDSVTLADALVADAGIALLDSMTPADALIADATKVLSDSMTPADALIADAAKVLADSLTPLDSLSASGSGAINLSDSVTLADALLAYAAKVLSDSITPTDALAGAAGVLLADDAHLFEAYLTNLDELYLGDAGRNTWSDGNHIFFANYTGGFSAFTFDGVTLTHVASIDDGGLALNVSGDGSFIYGANGSDGVRAYTFDGVAFTNVGHVNDGGDAYGVYCEGGYIYVASGLGGLRVYTFDGAAFHSVDQIDDGGEALAVFVHGGFIYLPNHDDGLRAYTLVGGVLTNVGHVDDGGQAFDVWCYGSHIYLANDGDGLRIYTFDGAVFNNVAHHDDGGRALRVWVDQYNIFLATYDDGLRVYTFDGAIVTNVAHINDGGLFYGVRPHGSYLTVAKNTSGLAVYSFHAGLLAGAGKALSDSVTLSDLLSASGGGSALLSDSVSLSDALLLRAGKALSDAMTLSDSLATDGGSGIGTPIGYEALVPIDSGPKGSQQGITNVTNRARPLCSLVTSGSNTIYTATSVEDTDGWDLSEVARHNVVATQDGYVGEVLSTLGNVVNVTSWHTPGGSDMAGKAADKPTDGQGATIHKVIRAASILISADRVNDKPVWLGMTNGVLPENGFPISNNLGAKNAYLTLNARLAKRINLSKIWVVAGSAQTLHWTTDGLVGEPSGSDSVSGLTFVDRAHTSDALSVSAGKVLADSVSVLDTLSVSAGSLLADSVTLQDSLSGVLNPNGPGPPVMPIINDVAYFSASEYVALAIQSVTYGHGILIFDVTDPTNPTRVGWVQITNGPPIRLAISGSFLYASTNSGLTIVNIGTPSAPSELSDLSLYSITSPAPGIVVSGQRCYIAEMANGLKIIDITDPASPVELPGHDFDTQNAGTYAYPDQFDHGGFSCGYFSYPVAPADPCFPYGPVQVHYFSGGKGVRVDASYIYVTGSGRIWRLLRSDTPTVDRIWTVCQGPGETGIPESFDIAAGIPYVHMAGTGDINLCGQALAENLNSISHNAPMTGGLTSNLSYPKSIYRAGVLFTLRRFGISGVSFPIEEMDLTVGARGFTVNGNYLYVGVSSGGWSLRVYDISTLSAPVLVGTGT